MADSGLFGPCFCQALARLRKLRAAVVEVVWSRRQSLANTCAVLSLLDGPSGCDPSFSFVRFRFHMFRWYLADRPGEGSRVYRLLEHAADGCPGHGPVHLLVESAAEVGFVWSPNMVGWCREGLQVLGNLVNPIQHFRSAVLEGWREKVSADFCARKDFWEGPWLDVDGTLQLFDSDHVRERDKALLRGILVGSVWNGCLLGKGERSACTLSVLWGADSDGQLFGECPFPLLVEIREHPEFHDLMEMDKSSWPRCSLCWLPLLSGVNGLTLG